MRTLRALGASAAIAAASMIITAGRASAAETKSAALRCDSKTYTVTGFGRGQVLFVTGSTQRFIVTFAEITSGANAGKVVFEAPGQERNEQVVTCTATSPISNVSFVFRGFFTPRAHSAAGARATRFRSPRHG